MYGIVKQEIYIIKAWNEFMCFYCPAIFVALIAEHCVIGRKIRVVTERVYNNQL